MTPLGLLTDSMWKRCSSSLQPSPQRFPAPKYDGHQGNVHVIDQVRSQELADGRRPPADADVQLAGGLSRRSEGLDGTRVDEVERCTAVQLEGWSGIMITRRPEYERRGCRPTTLSTRRPPTGRAVVRTCCAP